MNRDENAMRQSATQFEIGVERRKPSMLMMIELRISSSSLRFRLKHEVEISHKSLGCVVAVRFEHNIEPGLFCLNSVLDRFQPSTLVLFGPKAQTSFLHLPEFTHTT